MTTRARRLQNLRQGPQRSNNNNNNNGNLVNNDGAPIIASSTTMIHADDECKNDTNSNDTILIIENDYDNDHDDEVAWSVASSSASRTPTGTSLRERLKKIEAATRSSSVGSGSSTNGGKRYQKQQQQDQQSDIGKKYADESMSTTTGTGTTTRSESPSSPKTQLRATTSPATTSGSPKTTQQNFVTPSWTKNNTGPVPPPPPPPPRQNTALATASATSTSLSIPIVSSPEVLTALSSSTSNGTDSAQENAPAVTQSTISKPSTATATESTPIKTASAPDSHNQNRGRRKQWSKTPSLDPYIGKLERYELFCTNQSYYLVGCNKQNSQYRVIKMDRTLIERPVDSATMMQHQQQQHRHQQPTQVQTSASYVSHMSDHSLSRNTINSTSAAAADNSHNSKPTLRNLSEFLFEDPNVYSQGEIQEMLDMIHDGNRLFRDDQGLSPNSNGNNNNNSNTATNNTGGGGLKPIAKAYGIVGFIKFLDCYYLTLITRRAKVGSIGGNGIYTIKATETFPIKPAERMVASHNGGDLDVHADPSSVLLNMWNRGKRSVGLGLTNREIAELRYQGLYQVVDLTKNFFFSYTYDLTKSLQENFLVNASQPFPPPPFKDMFAWNFFLTRELENCTNSLSSFQWVMPIIHGAFVQRKLHDYGRSLNVILLARRSRHFAGTRYLKRGVSEQGKVANDVEHEQILHDESKAVSNGVFSSFLQVRGSIPTFWTQESSVTMPKPPIELNRVDPTYTATQFHFEDLMTRYGSPIVVLDLVKQSEKREREVRVGNEFRHGIEYINTHIDDDDHKIRYCALDYSHISKHRHLDVSTSLNEVSTWAVNQTGFFCSSPEWKITKDGHIEPFSEKDYQAASLFPEKFGVPTFPMEQTGVLRTNCIDCLDRTNVAQFSAGVEAMEQQLVVMGIRSNPKLDPSSNVVRVLIDMYVDIGDHIALQYGGSEAHKKVTAERSESIVGPIGKHKELLTSIRRYYSNAFTDRLKQDAMNLFLGYYVPYRHTVPLWEMETDYYLHNRHIDTGKGMRAYQESFGVLEWDTYDDTDNATEVGSSVRTSARGKRNGGLRDLMVPEHSLKIQKVRDRCTSQNKALSNWWKVAIQRNVQQRMWMQLGRSPTESLLPPRFERLYQPEKLAQFDRFFARSWATPVRRSHAAQHGGDAEEELSEYHRNIYRPLEKNDETKAKADADEKEDTYEVLDDIISKQGFEPKKRSTLRRFVQQHDIVDDEIPTPRSETSNEEEQYESHPSYHYIGEINNGFEPREEYVRCVKSSDYLESGLYNPVAFDEFKESLHALSINANEVDEIQELAESGHVGREIKSGPYKGLDRNFSSIEFSTVVFEQLNAYENIRRRGKLKEGVPVMDAELMRRGFYTNGVREMIADGWDQHVASEKQYHETCLPGSSKYRRSDVTTTNSLKLYTSFFSPDQCMATPALSVLLGEIPASDVKIKPGHVALKYRGSDFVSKAAKKGISITSHKDLGKSQPLFSFGQRHSVPEGFEMINDDMFSRKDNKFMVFNGPGVDSWSGYSPQTKISGIEKMLAGTL
ncbi:SacI homology domain containing protein [Nitzschia inconspicua]|uniref:SacI homology domain containing protein n=1 Tax=Nitzschia inconspicua TaxID=303405 RepID=A0A9K3PG44_9STRA|nr:SacI homology domain containing protein [Nitzschia inconspicua]